MKKIYIIFLFLIFAAFSQQSSIDLDIFKKSKKYSYFEKAYKVGNHKYTIVNIKPLYSSDTICISALVIDKRKYVLYDIGTQLYPTGIAIPQTQPIKEGLIILKLSPDEGKMFLALENGKVITLPGDLVFADTIGKCIYCVWDNNKSFRLTVFDYKNLKLIFNCIYISGPKQWYSDGFNYGFLTEDNEYYTVDFMTKKILKSSMPQDGLSKVDYIFNKDKILTSDCCSQKLMR